MANGDLLLAVPTGGGQGLLDRPPSFEPQGDGVRAHTEQFRPLGQRPDLATELDEPIRSTVVALLLLRRPPAVPGFVVAVVVDAVDRIVRTGFRPHVGQEGRKPKPPLTDLDPPAAVTVEVPVLRVLTPLPHVGPSAVLRRLAARPRVMAVSELGTRQRARLPSAFSESASGDDDDDAAGTPALPRGDPESRAVAGRPRVPDDRQLPVGLARLVSGPRVWTGRIIGNHDVDGSSGLRIGQNRDVGHNPVPVRSILTQFLGGVL